MATIVVVQRVGSSTNNYIFYFPFDVAITNAYILYKNFHPHRSKGLLTIKDF